MPKFYITTSIPYVNDAPHVGHALEFAEADAIARYHRALGDEVFFLTGTDEHGKKIFDAAKKAGKAPQEFVDGISARVRELLAALDISYDNFIRTSDERVHIPAVKKIWAFLTGKGDIYKGTYQGKYCDGCEAFLREAEIRDGKCIIHEKQVQDVREENYFFRFSKYAKQVEKLVREGTIGILPEHRKKEALNLFSEEGIGDVSVSRPAHSVGWGISVPEDDSQTMYVWVDALANYLSGIGFDGEGYKKWWPPDAHVIGKDIVRFHTLVWPAMLLSLGLQMPRRILVHGHISIEGRKMSKSLGNVVDPMELARTYGKDAVRYYLLREIQSDADGDFSFERMRERYVADLQNGLGNLVSRVTTLAEKYPSVWKDLSIHESFDRRISGPYEKALDAFRLHDALAVVWGLVAESNKHIDGVKLWSEVIQNPSGAKESFGLLARNLCFIGRMLSPFLPDTAKKVLKSVGAHEGSAVFAEFKVMFQKPSTPLFPPLV